MAAHFVERKRTLSLCVLLEDLACRPLDREKVHSRSRFADLDRANDVGMLHALAVSRFAKEARDRGAILAQFFAQDFDGYGAVVGMLRAENGGGSAFSDFALQ